MCRRYLKALWTALWGCYFGYAVVLYPAFMVHYWMPYLNREWKSATCTVTKSNEFSLELDAGWDTSIHFTYTRLHVVVNITGQILAAFACGSPKARASFMFNEVKGYPTEYNICPKPDTCGRELFLPLWTCMECASCDEQLAYTQPCLWRVHNLPVDLSSVSLTYAPPFPMPGAAFIHVILSDSAYYSLSEFIGLQIVGLAGTFIPPLLLLYWVRKKIKARRAQYRAVPAVQVAPPPPPPLPVTNPSLGG